MKARARIGARIEAIHADPTFAEGIELTADDWLKTRAQQRRQASIPSPWMIKERVSQVGFLSGTFAATGGELAQGCSYSFIAQALSTHSHIPTPPALNGKAANPAQS